MSNIVRAIFGGSKTTRTRRLWKIDKGMLLQFVDLNLPTAYQVHFANTPASGQAKVVTATSDTVEIPYEYLQTGADVYAWVYLTPESGVGYTEYMVTIPVYARPDTTDEEPTPAQQSALDTAISALNSGVESVQAAVAGVQNSIDAALQEAKDSGEFDGADGYTPVKGVDYFDGEKGDTGATGETGNGIASAVLNADYTLTLTYTDGTTWTSGSIRGERGDKGETGADGYSPAATVTQTETGATVTVTDKTGTTTAEISNGQDGAPGAPGSPGNDGVSPTISVTDITGGHRVTITDAIGTHSFDVMNGESGAGAVQDVQVAGVSMLSDGVANVPIAGTSTFGVIKVNGSLLGHLVNNDGLLYHAAPSATLIKQGTDGYHAISPFDQHQSTFYGLAKAAGSDEKNSTLSVGQYTESAKSAIHEMLGIGTARELRAFTELGEDMSEIEIPLPERYEKVWFHFMCRINNSDNNLPDGTTQLISWLGDTSIFNQTTMPNVYENVYIRQSNIFMIRVWFVVDFPFVERFATLSYGANNWSAKSTVNSFGGSGEFDTDRLTSYPRSLYIRPYDTSKGYLFKANSKLGVYVK